MRMVVIADDITGAFDTGVQFSKRGARVHVLIGDPLTEQDLTGSADVVVIDAETRHLTPERAYGETKRIAAMAHASGARYLYIKTDSGLRGNIASAFQAAMKAYKTNFAVFAPAYPALNRLTIDGVQYVDGVPLHQSVYGCDLFNPVEAHSITELFAKQGLYAENRVPDGLYTAEHTPTVGVFDVKSDADFHRIAREMGKQNRLQVTGGCAGFAAALAEYLHIGQAERWIAKPCKPLITVCGSLNPISLRQMEHAEQQGGCRIHLTRNQLLADGYFHTPEGEAWLKGMLAKLDGKRNVMFDSCGATLPDASEPIRVQIASNLGKLMERLISLHLDERYMPFVIGGDTLMGFLKHMQSTNVMLLQEAAPGVVLFSIGLKGRDVLMLSKSGGFGADTLLDELAGSPVKGVSAI